MGPQRPPGAMTKDECRRTNFPQQTKPNRPMQPTQTNTESLENDLKQAAHLIAEHAEAEGWTKAEMIRQLPALKSDRTFDRIRAGDFSAIGDLAGLHAAYTGILDNLEAAASDDDPLYDDLSTTKAVRAQMIRLKLSRTKAKLIIVEGFTGSGKTSAGQIVARSYNAMATMPQVFTIEASAGWSDRPNAMLTAMLRALGREATARSQAARLDMLTTVLNERPVIFIIDEVHDFGVRCLRVVKTLLNESPVKIIMLCHPRLFRDLERDNWDDLSQLTGNRLLARIELGTLNADDVALLLKRRLPTLQAPAKETETTARSLADMALNHGNLAFVRETILRVHKASTKAKEAPTTEAILHHAKLELRARAKTLRLAA